MTPIFIGTANTAAARFEPLGIGCRSYVKEAAVCSIFAELAGLLNRPQTSNNVVDVYPIPLARAPICVDTLCAEATLTQVNSKRREYTLTENYCLKNCPHFKTKSIGVTPIDFVVTCTY